MQNKNRFLSSNLLLVISLISLSQKRESVTFLSSVSADVDGACSWPLVAQRSHSFCVCFDCPCFWAIMKFLMQTQLTHSFCLPLCSYLLTVKKLSRGKQQLGGQSRRPQLQQPFHSLTLLVFPSTLCPFTYLQDLLAQSWFSARTAFPLCPPPLHRHFSVRHTNACTNTNSAL